MRSDDDERRFGAPFAIVSGGSSGIGLSCAGILARQNVRVVLLARDPERLQAAHRALGGGDRIGVRAVDVRDATATSAAVSALVSQYGAPDWVISAAGIVEPGRFLEQPLERHREQMESNHFGSLHLAHACLPAMADAGRGRLVFISSGAGLLGVPGYSGYAASKFAVRGLAETLRVEMAPHGVSVSVAFPPDTDTPQLAYEFEKRPPETALIAGGGGLWVPERVAAEILRAATKGHFEIPVGWPLKFIAYFGSSIAFILRRRHAVIVKKSKNKYNYKKAI